MASAQRLARALGYQVAARVASDGTPMGGHPAKSLGIVVHVRRSVRVVWRPRAAVGGILGAMHAMRVSAEPASARVLRDSQGLEETAASRRVVFRAQAGDRLIDEIEAELNTSE